MERGIEKGSQKRDLGERGVEENNKIQNLLVHPRLSLSSPDHNHQGIQN